MPLPKLQNADPAKMAAINYAKNHTEAFVDVLIVASEGELPRTMFVSTTVDDYRYLAAWLTAAGLYGKRTRRNATEFDALVLWVVSHMNELLGIGWQPGPPKPQP